MNKIYFICLLMIALLINCSTAPVKVRVPEKGKRALGNSVVTISVPHYSDAKDIAAFVAGLTGITGSMKTMPTIPEDLKVISRSAIEASLSSQIGNASMTALLDAANKVASFDSLLLVYTDPITITDSILGFTINSSPGMMVNAAIYDSKAKSFIVACRYPQKVSDGPTRIMNINTGASSALKYLIGE